MKLRKRIGIIGVAVGILLSGIQSYQTAYASEAQVLYLETQRVEARLALKNGQVYCTAVVRGQKGTTNIYVTMRLIGRSETGEVVTDVSWNGIGAAKEYLTATRQVEARERCTYYLNLTATINRDGRRETVSRSSEIKN